MSLLAVGLLVFISASNEFAWGAAFQRRRTALESESAQARWDVLSEPLTDDDQRVLETVPWEKMSAADSDSLRGPGRASDRGLKAIALLLSVPGSPEPQEVEYTRSSLLLLLASDLDGRASEAVQYFWLLGKKGRIGSTMRDVASANFRAEKQSRLFTLRTLGELFRAGQLKTDKRGRVVGVPLRVGYDERDYVTALIYDGTQKLLSIRRFPPTHNRRLQLAQLLQRMKKIHMETQHPIVFLFGKVDQEIERVIDRVVDFPFEAWEWPEQAQHWRLVKIMNGQRSPLSAEETLGQFGSLPEQTKERLSWLLKRLDPSVRRILFRSPPIRADLVHVLSHPPPPGVTPARFLAALSAILERGEFNYAVPNLIRDVRTLQSVPGIEFALEQLAYRIDPTEAIGYLYELHVDARLREKGALEEVGVFAGRSHEVDALAKDGSAALHKLVSRKQDGNGMHQFERLLREIRVVSDQLNRSSSGFVGHWHPEMFDTCCKFTTEHPEITFSIYHLQPGKMDASLKFKHVGKTPEPLSRWFRNENQKTPHVDSLDKLKNAAKRMK